MNAAHCQLTVEGMHCNSCGLLVDETVEDLDGVTRCTTDVRRGRARVEFEPTLVTVAEITAAITGLGYPSAPVVGDDGR